VAKLAVQTSTAYTQFVNSLRSAETRRAYIEWLNDFLKYTNLSCDQILGLEPKEVQEKIIGYIVDMRDNRKLSPNSIRSRSSAIQTFLEINDFDGINWVKVKRFKGEFYTVAEDRPYTREEIKTLADNARSLRDRAIILLLSSSGLRIGGLIRLQLKHIKRVEKYNAFQLEVYKKSREAYTTFCTPESRIAIEDYLEWRTRLGEKLIPESPLFRLEFETKFGARAPAKPVRKTSVYNMIKKLRFQTGIVHEQHLTENVKLGYPRSEVMNLHGFRKYFATTLETEGVNPVYIDLLLGHDMGLKGVYSKPTPAQLLQGNGDKVLGYIHGIDALTINEENRLKIKVRELGAKQDEIMLMRLKHEHEMKSVREEMKKQFDQIMVMIQQNPKLANIKPEALANKTVNQIP
jgi:integrase